MNRRSLLSIVGLVCALIVIGIVIHRQTTGSRPTQVAHSTPDTPAQLPTNIEPAPASHANTSPAQNTPEPPPPSPAPHTLAENASGNLWQLTPHEITTPDSPPPQPGTPLIVADLDTSAAAQSLPALKEGDTIQIPLPSGSPATGHVNLVQDDNGVLRIGGGLPGWKNGSFSLALINGRLMGTILLPEIELAYEIEPTGPTGNAHMLALPLSSVICHPLPRPPDEPNTPDTPVTTPRVMAMAAEPLAAAPILSSRPDAPIILYLCFDGATVRDSRWNSGNVINAAASTLTTDQIEQVWKRVAEDYSPFNVDVTTSASRYNNSRAGKRMRCIITPNYSWYSSSAGGVAYLNSFSKAGSTYSSDIPCWVFNSSPDAIAEAASHELGHTLGLDHDGRTNPNEEYFHGHGTSPMSWGPIMGASYYTDIVQWSKGEYDYANNHEDDIAIILKSVNGITYATATTGSTRQTAKTLQTSNGAFTTNGVIITQNSTDYHSLTVNTSQYISIKATPATLFANPTTRQRIANLDILMTLLDSSGNIIDTDNPSTATDASIERNLPSGTYYIKIEGSGYGDPRTNGYSKYGSIGQYTITGTTTAPVSAPQIVTHPQTKTATSTDYNFTLSVTATGAGTLRYQWQKDGANIATSERITNVTGSTLTVYNPETPDTGSYTVTVRNAGGEITSNAATVTVTAPPPPTITNQPTSQAVLATAYSFSLSVSATGAGSLRYQWQKDGIDLVSTSRISGVNSNYLYIYNPEASDAGAYTVKVSNPGGTTTSQTATITVKLPAEPIIGRHPSNVTAYIGESSYLYLSTYATGEGYFSYQWQKNGVDLVASSHYSGVHSSSLFIYDYTEDDAGEYRVIVSNKGGSATSNTATVTIKMPDLPVIVTQPEGKNIQAGESSTTFSVYATGIGLSYQWLKNGTEITDTSRYSGAKYSYMYINYPTLDDAGTYTVRVTNAAGSVLSQAATLTVTLPPLPVIKNLTGSMSIYDGEPFTLSCNVSSVDNTKYQWYKDGSPIINATSKTYNVATTTTYNAGTYKLAATNPSGVSYGAEIKITIIPATLPQFIIHPENRNAYAGQTVTLTAAATGRPAPTYQWYQNGTSIAYATNPEYIINPAQTSHSGTYTVVATNKAGSVTGNPAELTILATNSGAALGIYPETKTVGCERVTYRLWVNSNIKWTLENDAPWISASRTAGSFEDIIEITIAPNPIPLQRTATIKLAGFTHTITQHAAGTPVRELWGAGNNANGQLGIYKPLTPYYPKQIPINVATLAAGGAHTLFLKADGTLWASGNNYSGQLGDGTTTTRFTPVLIATNVAYVAAGDSHTLFIKNDKTLWTVGNNTSGQLGNGTTAYYAPTPTPVCVATDVISAAAGYSHSVFIKSDNTLWGMGSNYNGQLGDGSTSSRTSPAQITTGVKAVAAGGNHTLYIKTDNTLWATGYNYYGQLGDDSIYNRYSPYQVTTNVKAIAARADHSHFIKNDNTLWAMGSNGSGQLGDGRATTRQGTPVQIATNVQAIAAGTEHSLYLKQDATLWATGNNYYGQLGDGTTGGKTPAIQIASNVAKIYAGGYTSFYIETDGTLYGIGANDSGALGTINQNTTSSPPPVHIASDIQTIAAGEDHTLCVTTDGVLLGFGLNTSGQLGDGTVKNRTTPFQIATEVRTAAGGSQHSLFIKTDGSLWAMGYNSDTRLGDPTPSSTRTTPIQVAANIKTAAAGSAHSLYIDNSGQLWGTGDNYYGQLGAGTTQTNNTSRPPPTPITTNAETVAAGSAHTLLLKTDRALYSAGYSYSGQTAQNNLTSNNLAQIATGITAIAAGASHSLWIDDTGTLYAVGLNDYGQYGSGTTTPYSSSTPRVTATNARLAAAGRSHSLYIGTDNTLYSAGANTNGQLADNTTANRSAFTPVAANIDTAAAGSSHTLFIATGDIRLNPPPPPAITNFAPAEIIAQSRIVITGSHFTNAAGVYFGNTPAQSYTVSSDTQITAYAPVTPPKDGANISVGTFDGIATSAATYTAAYEPMLGDTIPDQLVVVGGTLTIHAPALGAPDPTVTWQYSTDNGATWNNVPSDLHHSGATTPTLTITNAALTLNGNRYRFTATNTHGSITSDSFTLTIARPPALVTQTGNITVNAGVTATLNATFTATPAAALQWQISTDIGITWANLANTAPYNGVTTNTLTIAPATYALDGAYYRCTATNPHGNATTTPSRINVLVTPAAQTTIAAQSVVAGRDTTLIANVTGNPAPSIQWQISTDDGATWNNITNGAAYTGADTAMLDIIATTPAMNNYKYRYTATNSQGSTNSDPITLKILDTLLAQPEGLVYYSGNLYITDAKLHTLQSINTNSNITMLIAGQTGTAGNILTGTNAQFSKPTGIAISSGTIYIADTGNISLRMLSTSGTYTDYTRFSATNSALAPVAITAPEYSNTIYFTMPENHTVYTRSYSGTTSYINSIAGTSGTPGFADGYFSQPGQALLRNPSGITYLSGYVYIADTGNHAIRVIVSGSYLATLAGNGTPGSVDGTGTAVRFNSPRGMTVSNYSYNNSIIYVADTGNSTIRSIDKDGVVRTIAGNPGLHGLKDGIGQDAWFDHPVDIACDYYGNNLYIADTGNATIRKLDLATNQVTTLPIVSATTLAPVFTQHPQNVTITQGSGSNARLVVSATGIGTMSIKWQKNGADITNSSKYYIYWNELTINTPNITDSGEYRAIATNSYGTTYSNPSTLTVTATTSGTGGNNNGGGGGGGGAPTLWFLTAIAALFGIRLRSRI